MKNKAVFRQLVSKPELCSHMMFNINISKYNMQFFVNI